MKIKISQNQTIEIKTKWIIWGFVTVFIILPLLPPLGSALWTLIDESVCNQSTACRNARNGAKESERLLKEVERMSKEEDERHKK